MLLDRKYERSKAVTSGDSRPYDGTAKTDKEAISQG